MAEKGVVEFVAYLPPIQSAIMLDGTGDNLQVKLNIPLRTSPDAIRLAGMTGKRLKITVEEVEDAEKVEAGRKRKSEWSPAKSENLDTPAGESGPGQDSAAGRDTEAPGGSSGRPDLARVDVGSGDTP